MTMHDWEQYHLTEHEREQLRNQRAAHHDNLKRAWLLEALEAWASTEHGNAEQ